MVRAGFGRLGGLASRLLDDFGGGRLSRIYTLRLMACMGMAGVVSEVLPLQRSYWVPLTVAIVLKPDYGPVFARALQRGIGTVVGAVAGAALLVLLHGKWLLIPFAVLAALLPYGPSRNYGLLATFLTPLVVLLIDLLSPTTPRSARTYSSAAVTSPTKSMLRQLPGSGNNWSGWRDLNPRPRAPKARALAKLRYSPYLAECSGWSACSLSGQRPAAGGPKRANIPANHPASSAAPRPPGVR